MRDANTDGLSRALVIAVATSMAGIVACGANNDRQQAGQSAVSAKAREASVVSNQLQVEAHVRSFDFLRPGEIPVDVLIKNVGGSSIILDFRRDRRPSRDPKLGIVQPHRLLDLLTFRPVGMSGLIAKEERTSNERRHRDSLNEGALFENIVQLLPLPTGRATGVAAIVWSQSAQTVLGSTVRELEVEFNGLALAAVPEEVEIKESPFFGTVLLNSEKWESKEYSQVSVVGRFALGQ